MHRPTTLLAAATAALLVLAACGSDDEQADTTATDPLTPSTEPTTTGAPSGEVPAEIAGVHWVFDGYYTIAGLQPLAPANTGAGLTIQADGTVAVDTGCNQGSAMATFDDQLVQIGPIVVTEKACSDAVMRVETMLLGQLEEQQYWAVHEGQLQLTAANISDTGLHFHDAANPPTDSTTVPPTTTDDTTSPPTTTGDTTAPPTTSGGTDSLPAAIVDVHWVLDGYYTVAGLQPLPVADTGAGLTIAADGTVQLNGGCNQGSATATFDGELLQLTNIISTAKACTDEDVTRIEQMLFGQLQEQQYWDVHDGVLQLTGAHVSDTGLHFHDAKNPPDGDDTGDTISPPAT